MRRWVPRQRAGVRHECVFDSECVICWVREGRSQQVGGGLLEKDRVREGLPHMVCGAKKLLQTMMYVYVDTFVLCLSNKQGCLCIFTHNLHPTPSSFLFTVDCVIEVCALSLILQILGQHHKKHPCSIPQLSSHDML